MVRLILLTVGGGLGTLLRYWVNGLISDRQGRQAGWAAVFPLGTLVVNVTGSFVIGFLAALTGAAMGRAWLKPEWRDFLMIGLCGGYTTFSSFSLQTMNLARDGEWLAVAANILGSNVLCLLAVYLGWVSARLLQARVTGGSA
jgi:CrcB protein